MAEVAEKVDVEEKRSVMISVRLTKEDADGLRSDAAAAGESMSDYLRKQLINRNDPPAQSPEMVVTSVPAPKSATVVTGVPVPVAEVEASSETAATSEPLDEVEALNTLPFSETLVTGGVSMEYRDGRLLPLSDRPFVTPLSPA